MDEMASRNTDLEIKIMQPNELAQAPETGILGQVDPSTLQIIQKLFTRPGNGPAFLAQILRFAEVKQMALPGVEGTADVAVITLQTIRELAKKIRWGYDTTHKYVVVFCALNLLVKCRCEGRIQLLFSLKQYTPPPTSKALDSLINKSRPKVRQFANRVKHRCILYNIIQQGTAKQEEHSTLEQQLLQQLQSILQTEHINQTQRQRLIMRISSEIFSKFIVTSGISGSLPPAKSFSPEQEKAQGSLSSHIIDSLVPDPITVEKTPTHESTPAQADIVTSDNLLASKEETCTLPTPLPETSSSSDRTFKPSEREAFRRESPPAQQQSSTQRGLLETRKAHETSSSKYEERESTPDTDDQASLKEMLRSQFSSSTSSQSRRKQQPSQIGGLLSHKPPTRRVDSPASSSPTRKMATPEQMDKVDSQNSREDESTMKSIKRASQASQEVSPSTINEYREGLHNTEGDSQTSKQLPERMETLDAKSSTEEKSSDQLKSMGDFLHTEVDFSAITQIHIENYSESFLRAYVTLNVIDFINKTYNKDVNVTSRTELARFLAEIMDNDSEKWKIHMKLLSNCQPDVIAGGLIHIFSKLYDRGGESIRNKAGLFTQYCKNFQAEGVPAGTILLANSLKSQTFEQMINFFKDRQQKVESHQPAQVKQTSVQTTSNSVFALEVPKESGTLLVKQGNRVVIKKLSYGKFKAQKKRIVKDS